MAGSIESCFHKCDVFLMNNIGGELVIVNKEGKLYGVKHANGIDYNKHCVVEILDGIWDPFLQDKGIIPREEYLERAFRNPDELKIVN